MNQNFSDEGLKKRIKAISISDTPLCVNEEVGVMPGPAQYQPAEPSVSSRIRSFFHSGHTSQKPKSSDLTAPELICQHILKVLDGADSLEELRILHKYSAQREIFGPFILYPICLALSNRHSLRRLHVEGHRLDSVLPLIRLCSLTTVSIAMRFTSEIWHSLGALPLFLKHVASSVEVLHVSALKGVHSGAISLAMTKIFCGK